MNHIEGLTVGDWYLVKCKYQSPLYFYIHFTKVLEKSTVFEVYGSDFSMIKSVCGMNQYVRRSIDSAISDVYRFGAGQLEITKISDERELFELILKAK